MATHKVESTNVVH